MSHSQFIALKKLKGGGIVARAAAHNLREIQKELGADSHIDASRIHLNRTLAGAASSDGVAAEAARLMEAAGVGKLRKDAVRAVEIVFSLPAGSSVDPDAFFPECLAWSRQYFGAPILSAVVHLDEPTQGQIRPHMHVLVLPLRDGRMNGGRMMGNKNDLRALQDDFQGRVGGRYRLTRESPQKRHSAAAKRAAAVLALDAIRADASELNKPAVVAALLELFGANPEPLLTALNRRMPASQNKGKSFVQIMTAKVKPIDFAPVEKSDVYHCVDFAPSAALPSPIPSDKPGIPPASILH